MKSFELQALEEPTKTASVTEGTALDTHSEVVLFYLSNLYVKTKALFSVVNWVMCPPFSDVLPCPTPTTNRRAMCCHWSSPAGPTDHGNPSVCRTDFFLFLYFCLIFNNFFSVKTNFPAPMWIFSKFPADEHRVRWWQGRWISPPTHQRLFPGRHQGKKKKKAQSLQQQKVAVKRSNISKASGDLKDLEG